MYSNEYTISITVLCCLQPVREDRLWDFLNRRSMPNFKKKYEPKKKPRKRGSDDRKTWIDKLDKVFSLYVRMRDSRPFHFQQFRCISCGKVKPTDQMDCGHYVGRSCMPLRWNSMNCNGECRFCNRMDSSHLIGYRKNLIVKLGTDAISGSAIAQALEPQKRMELIKRLGEQHVQSLEAQKYATKKWSIEELKEQYMYYAALVLEFKNEM